MNDTQRLDALDTYGLCIAHVLVKKEGAWTSRWVCHYGIDQSIEAPTIREAIDGAVGAQTRGEQS